jgi:hypothetical protein
MQENILETELLAIYSLPFQGGVRLGKREGVYGTNIIDTTHKVRDGVVSWSDGRKNLAEARKKIADEWKDYTGTYLAPEEKKLVDEATPLMKTADEAVDKLSAIFVKEDKGALAGFVAKGLYPAIDPFTDKISNLTDLQVKVAKQVYEKSDAYYQKGKMGLTFLIVLYVLISAALATLVIRGLLKELGGEPSYVKEIARTVAKGAVSSEKSGESLREILDQINEVNMQINQIATAAEQQTATISEITTNIHQVTEIVHQSARGAEETSTAAAQLAEQSQQLQNLVGKFKVA